ncbi:ABC transporter permease [Fictibacillus barbaricus]|uniref:ABC transporter permease n=1 Tax=Fictibacillus barbaricus TaxID=182136 RepID=A0ABS2ZHY7_9BACL|nr:FtsX-like permease family protein [Fictibacillus barbaricus]MBN3547022.1 ABC transporter permease [Fictibacillus barbaricus]GGB45845.1 ABC transporter permease YtrF [Fictibacillus barbaricus]
MKFKDKHRFVRSNMKKNRTRVWMTILASTIGCAFLIMLASVGFAIHKTAIDDVMSYRMMNEIQIQKENSMLEENDVKKLEQIKGVKAVTRKKYTPANQLSIDEYNTYADVKSAHMPSEEKAGFELEKGRLPQSKNEIVIGYHFAENLRKDAPKNFLEGLSEEEAQKKMKELSYKGDLLNKTITYHMKTDNQNVKVDEQAKTLEVKIVGIGKKPTKEWAMDNYVFITEDLYKEVFSILGEQDPELEAAENNYSEVNVYTASADEVKAVSEKIEKLDYLTYSVVSELKELNIYFTLFKAGLIFIGAIAVLIASIGIFNTMTMAVTERSQDIGIMKAIGATPKTIKRIFLLESGYIGLWGVGLGTILAYVISYGVNFALPIIIEQFINEKPPEDFILSYIPWSLTVISVTICMGVTLLSGWRPAAKATTVDVLKALRRDV